VVGYDDDDGDDDGAAAETILMRDVRASSGKNKNSSHYKVMDASFKHPFTMLVAGPSGSGKSTFVHKLLLMSNQLIDEKFDYIYIFIGTNNNPLFSDLASKLKENFQMNDVYVVPFHSIYPTVEDQKVRFPKELPVILNSHHKKGKKGCLIFDDLMQEMSKSSNILVNCFSKYSTHNSASFIYLTQNLFSGGNKASDMVSVYRNTKYLVLFNSEMDKTFITHVVSKMGPGGKKNGMLSEMLKRIMLSYRYVIIRADGGPSDLQFSSDIFGEKMLFSPITETMVRYQSVFIPTFWNR